MLLKIGFRHNLVHPGIYMWQMSASIPYRIQIFHGKYLSGALYRTVFCTPSTGKSCFSHMGQKNRQIM